MQQITENEIYEIRIYETAPPGTKATLNEAFDRLMREQKNCFAQLEIAADVDWIEFDSGLLMFLTTTNVPSSARTTQQAILHLMCSLNKMRSIHFSIHVTRRNRHPPKFSADNIQFYAPITLNEESEIGRLHVLDNDPIIYNSQVQLNILPYMPSINQNTPALLLPSQTVLNNDNIESHWQIFKNGSLYIQKPMTDLQLYRPYTIRVLAVDFGSPQLFSICNVTIVPVSVSPPQNVRVNVANTEYQIFEWDSPSFGIPEKYKLSICRNNIILYTQEIEQNENIALSRMRFPSAPDFSVIITAVDVDGETPSEPHTFMLIKAELNCEGECFPQGGAPLCYYGNFHKIEQYRDSNDAHCLCYDGFSSPQCDIIESCSGERIIESYGGVDWPFTSVNQSASIACPYNANKETITRKCIWDSNLSSSRWENVSNNDICKKQSSILVHLGVLANYAQRVDQTASGLNAVQRFLSSILQMPAFQPEIAEAHFDAKIAEHVSQVIDTVAAINLSTVSGNTTDVSNALVNYIIDFSQRIPVPFHLQSSEGGFQIKTWYWVNLLTIQSAESEVNNIGDEFPTQFGRRCYVHLPSHRHQKIDANGQLIIHNSLGSWSQIIRVACLRSSTILPLLDGRSPLLFATIDVDSNEIDNFFINNSTFKKNSNDKKEFAQILQENVERRNILFSHQKLAKNTKALIALRLNPAFSRAKRKFDLIENIRNEINYTCAIYDYKKAEWTIKGITVLSRNFEDGFTLCETTHLGIFALLPETLFEIKQESPFKILIKVLPIASSSFAILCTIFLLLIALMKRPKCTDPALITFLLIFLFFHSLHLIVLVILQFSFNFFNFNNDCIVYLILQFCMIGIASLMTLINSSTHARIMDLELGVRHIVSLFCRLFSTFIFGIGLPFFCCIITWLFNAYIYYNLTTSTPSLKPFNWIFGLTFFFPLIIFIGSSTGYAFYSYYRAKILKNLSTPFSVHHITLLSNSSASAISTAAESTKFRLLRDLSNSSIFSFIILILFYANAFVFCQQTSIGRNILLSLLHFGISGAVFVFAGLLYRIESKFPRYALHNHISEASYTYSLNNNYNLINDIKLNNSNNNFKNSHSNGTNYAINNNETNSTTANINILSISTTENEYTKNDKIINGTNYESNDFIYDSVSNKNGLRMSNWKQRINDEDADSGRLTLVSPPPSTFSIITQQQQLNSNSNNLELENNNILNSKSTNINSSPLSGLGTISTSSNNSTQHNLMRYEDITNSTYEQQIHNNGKNEFANIRRGSQPIINAAMRASINHSIGYYDSILRESIDNSVRILNKHSDLNKNVPPFIPKAIYKPKNYRTSALHFQKQEENKINEKHMLLSGNQKSLKLNLNYEDRIIAKSETSQETNNTLLVTNKFNKNTVLNNENNLTTLCLKASNHDNTSDLMKKLLYNNNYLKIQPLINDIRQPYENENEIKLEENKMINEDLNNNKLLNISNENEEMNHPIVSVV